MRWLQNLHRAALLGCVFGGILVFSGTATALEKPKGQPILIISGNIGVTNNGRTAEFDREMLEAIGMQTVTTSTPWYSSSVSFEGVSLSKLMALVDADGTSVKAIALNDYTTAIPLSDFADHGTILAMKRDGEYMSVREKGPLFIVYPYDSDQALQSQTYYGRSAWQLSRIIVE